MKNIESATESIFGPRLVQGPEAIAFPALLELLKNIGFSLLFGQLCRPSPPEVVEFVTRRFGRIQKLLGAERRRDNQVRKMLAEHWAGDPDKLPAIHAQVKAAATAGKITEDLVVGVFRDVHAVRFKWMDDIRHSE